MLYCYHLPPIDFWAGAMTAQALLASIEDWEANAGLLAKVAKILADLEIDAREGFEKVGWEGDITCGPYFFVLPGEVELFFGCMLKQSNNGATFVASPHPLPWLDEISLEQPHVLNIRRSS